MKRFHMQKAGLMVQHHYRETLEAIRKTDRRFCRARIRDVLQLAPDRCKVGVVYIVNGNGETA